MVKIFHRVWLRHHTNNVAILLLLLVLITSLSQVLSQVCPKLEKEYYASVIKVLAGLSKESQSLRILMQLTGDTNRGRFKNNVLSHILEAGFVEPTITNNPNSPKQRYILTEKGKEMMNAYEI